MSETVKGYQRGEIVRGEHPVNVTTFVSLNDYAALSKRLAETEAIAKSLLDKAPAQADEMRRMGAQVVELSQRNAELEKVVKAAIRWNELQMKTDDECPADCDGDCPVCVLEAAVLVLSAKPHAEVSDKKD